MKNSIGRHALDVADRLEEVFDEIVQDDEYTRSHTLEGLGYITEDEISVLDEAISILQEYGRARESESFVDDTISIRY